MRNDVQNNTFPKHPCTFSAIKLHQQDDKLMPTPATSINE